MLSINMSIPEEYLRERKRKKDKETEWEWNERENSQKREFVINILYIRVQSYRETFKRIDTHI